jgi:hypothetical protein
LVVVRPLSWCLRLAPPRWGVTGDAAQCDTGWGRGVAQDGGARVKGRDGRLEGGE